jgi:hypothetical protein
MKWPSAILSTVLLTLMLTTAAYAQSPSREELQREIESKRAELAVLEEQFLSPSEFDRAAFVSFLDQPDTGLIRLLPREIYDSEVYRKNKKGLTLRGGGA